MFSIEKRPKTLSSFIGQEKIIKEFKNRSTLGINIPNVILLEGFSGTGKTSLIYILTKLVNCQNPVLNTEKYYEPCNECASCKDINEEKFSRDTTFIDCSQYRKEDVVNLHNSTIMSPMFDKNKVYILDEFQELGNSSTKGATLKLLEKLKKNVYFFLATMNITSIPEAIKRRCQVYNLKPVSYSILAEYLFNLVIEYNNIPEIFIKEGISVIAENSNGSPGIAIAYIERCINGELWTKEDIEKELGFISQEKEINILQGLLEIKKESLYDLYKIKDIQTFYYKTKKILLDASIYKITNKIDQIWKIKTIKKLNFNNLIKLLSCYDIQDSYTFNKYLFLNKIIKYYMDFSSIKNKRVIKE